MRPILGREGRDTEELNVPTFTDFFLKASLNRIEYGQKLLLQLNSFLFNMRPNLGREGRNPEELEQCPNFHPNLFLKASLSSWMGDRLGAGMILSTRQLSSLGEIV